MNGMKQKNILLLILGALIALQLSAQKTFYVYRNDGTVNQFLISNVLSIELSKTGMDGKEEAEYVVQEIHTVDSVARIPIAQIDSVSFSLPASRYSLSDAYVPIDWEKTQLISLNQELGEYSISFADETPDIKEESVIVVENDSTSIVVLVTEVEKAGNIYNIRGATGDVSYLLFDTEISFNSKDDNYTIYDGNTQNVNKISSGRPKNNEPLTRHLWDNGAKEVESDIYESAVSHVYSKSKFELNLDFEANMIFSDPVDTTLSHKGKFFKFRKAKDYYLDTKLIGSADTYYDLYADINVGETEIDLCPGLEDKKNKYVSLKHNLFKPIHFSIPIPNFPLIRIPVTLSSDLYGQVSLKAEGELHFTTGFEANARVTVGANFHVGKNKETKFFTPYMEFDKHEVIPHDPTLSGKGKISGKVHVFPRLRALVGGLIGPSIDLKPYLQADLSGGFNKDLVNDVSEDYYAWSVETYAGVDIAVGLSQGSDRFDLETDNTSTGDINVLSRRLYSSPDDIEFASATPDKISKGEETTVAFKLYDKAFDDIKIITPLSQIVKFDGKGKIESTHGYFGVAKDGIVSARWTPTSSSDTLSARLYDMDGNVIREAQYSKNVDIDFDVVYPTEYRGCNYDRGIVFAIATKPILPPDTTYDGWSITRIGTILYENGVEKIIGDLVAPNSTYYCGHSIANMFTRPEALTIIEKDYIAKADKAVYEAGAYFEMVSPDGEIVKRPAAKKVKLEFIYDTKPEVYISWASFGENCKDEPIYDSEGNQIGTKHIHRQIYNSIDRPFGSFWMVDEYPAGSSTFTYVPQCSSNGTLCPRFEYEYEEGIGKTQAFASWVDVNGKVGRSNIIELDFDSNGHPIDRKISDPNDLLDYYVDREIGWPWRQSGNNKIESRKDIDMDSQPIEKNSENFRYVEY